MIDYPLTSLPRCVLAAASQVCLGEGRLVMFLCAFVSPAGSHFNTGVTVPRRKYGVPPCEHFILLEVKQKK